MSGDEGARPERSHATGDADPTVRGTSEDAWQVEAAPPATDVAGNGLSTRGERTRQSLLEAAELVFADLGYHEASIVKITVAAGVAQGTFYRYFPSKKAIFDELVAELNRRVRQAMSEASSGTGSRAEAERAGFEAFFRFVEHHPALYRIIRQAEFVSPAALHQHYERIARGYRAGLTSAMAAGEIVEADPEVLAWALMGVGELLGMRWILWGDTTAVPPEVREELLAFVLRGLGQGAGR